MPDFPIAQIKSLDVTRYGSFLRLAAADNPDIMILICGDKIKERQDFLTLFCFISKEII